ncbi:MAG: hypothetical protein JJE04_05690 [Acidobacteriia bacterium]|nr:hypothetical protein [Terriglobia bacterium]
MRAVQRLALIPLENLSGDASLDWIGPLSSVVLHSQTQGAVDLFTYQAASSNESFQQRPTRLLRGYYTRAGNNLHLSATLSDSISLKTLESFSRSGPMQQGPLPLLDGLARQLWPQAKPFSTRNAQAVQAMGEGLASGNLPSSIAHLRRAIELDPAFGEAYLSLIPALSASGQQEEGLHLLRQALAAKVNPVAHARLQWMQATAARLPEMQLSAAGTLVRLLPADAEVLGQLATLHMTRRQYGQAVALYRKALLADPSWPDLWNQAAYTEVRAGNTGAGIANLNKYASLVPTGANPLDSAGEIYFMTGRFKEAEQSFLDAYQKQPTFMAGVTLRKAAEARRMQGDLAGADALFTRYADSSASQPGFALARAHWEFTSGRKKKAMDLLRELAAKPGASPQLVSAALAQLSVWLLDAGDRAAAHQTAQQAMQTSAGGLAAMCLFVTDTETSASEWTLRAEKVFAHPSGAAIKRLALAYALLFNRHFREASLVLKTSYDQIHPNNEDHVKELLAWSYAEQNRWKEASPLLGLFPLPRSAGEEIFDCLVFPRGIALRAKALGRADLTVLYKKLVGG